MIHTIININTISISLPEQIAILYEPFWGASAISLKPPVIFLLLYVKNGFFTSFPPSNRETSPHLGRRRITHLYSADFLRQGRLF
jgi:hypothetical protein